jgi:hypothetical protein
MRCRTTTRNAPTIHGGRRFATMLRMSKNVPDIFVEPGRGSRPPPGTIKQKAPTDYVEAFCFNNGAQTRNRTTDTGIFNPLLYRLSYLGKNC